MFQISGQHKQVLLINNIYIILYNLSMAYFYNQEHNVKNKYTGGYSQRSVQVDINNQNPTIKISNKKGENYKEYPLEYVNFKQDGDKGLLMETGLKRKYYLTGNNTDKLVNAINQHNLIKNFQEEEESSEIMLPQTINYLGLMSMTNSIGTLSQQNQPSSEIVEEQKSNYPRQKSYLLEDDWQINKQRGGLTLISEEKKKNQTKILKYVLKKFVNTGSFMGISFPVFAMKPESILETYAKSIAAAPLLFDHVSKDPGQRMKHFVCFQLTFSRLFTDMDKPFNPVIGETFQTIIAGGLYSAEQTSHHPPQSSFYYQGKGYQIYSTIELVAKIGVNDADGLFEGDIHVVFDDGGHIFGRCLAGNMSGFILGENKFRPQGSSYAYDPNNKIVCTYKREKKDIFHGFVGTLKEKYQKKFEKTLKDPNRFGKCFDACQQKEFEMILSKVEIKWSKYVAFNLKSYFNFTRPEYLPFLPVKDELKNILPSDSSFRKDIDLRALKMMEQSQQEKQSIEQIERTYRKLRQKLGPKKK